MIDFNGPLKMAIWVLVVMLVSRISVASGENIDISNNRQESATHKKLTRLIISTIPPESQVTLAIIGDKCIEQTNEVRVPGWYQVTVSNPGYSTFLDLISLDEGETKKIQVRLVKSPTLAGNYFRNEILLEGKWPSSVSAPICSEYIKLESSGSFQEYTPPIILGLPSEYSFARCTNGRWSQESNTLTVNKRQTLVWLSEDKWTKITFGADGPYETNSNGNIVLVKLVHDERGYCAIKQDPDGVETSMVSKCPWVSYNSLFQQAVIRWGDRIYLLRQDMYRHFIYDICEGNEPRSSRYGAFFMKSDNLQKKPDGLPIIGGKWQKELIGAIKAKREAGTDYWPERTKCIKNIEEFDGEIW